MAATIDSEAYLEARRRAIGISDATAAAMRLRGFTTLGALAFSSSYTPGQADDAAFVRGVLEPLLGLEPERNPDSPRIRRLYVEAYSMSIGEIKRRIERTDADVPTKLPVEERKERMDRLRVRLPGLEIKGHLEPSHALVDLMVQMLEQGVLKYVPWSSCTCREQEVLGTKKADVGTTIVPLSNGLLKTQKADHLYIADTGDSLKLQNALQRRALAAELAGLCDYNIMQLLNIKLMKEFLREPLPHYKKISVAQLERADKLAFARVAELTEGGLSRDAMGRYPMAEALLAVIEDAEFKFMLMQLPESSSSTATESTAGKAEKPDKPNKGKGKGKGNKRLAPGAGADTSRFANTCNKTEDGSPICFAYQKGRCKAKVEDGARCSRGFHVCWLKGCGQPHPAKAHPK